MYDGFFLEQFHHLYALVLIRLRGTKKNQNLILNILQLFYAQTLRETTGRKIDLVTSISMFYDIEDPINFAKEVVEVIIDDGVWIVELVIWV